MHLYPPLPDPGPHLPPYLVRIHEQRNASAGNRPETILLQFRNKHGVRKVETSTEVQPTDAACRCGGATSSCRMQMPPADAERACRSCYTQGQHAACICNMHLRGWGWSSGESATGMVKAQPPMVKPHGETCGLHSKRPRPS